MKDHLEELCEVFLYVLDAYNEATKESGDLETSGAPARIRLLAWLFIHCTESYSGLQFRCLHDDIARLHADSPASSAELQPNQTYHSIFTVRAVHMSQGDISCED